MQAAVCRLLTIAATHHFYEELIRLGVGPLMEIDHGRCHSLYYVDPNGIMVEFCRDTPGIEPDHDLAMKPPPRHVHARRGEGAHPLT